MRRRLKKMLVYLLNDRMGSYLDEMCNYVHHSNGFLHDTFTVESNGKNNTGADTSARQCIPIGAKLVFIKHAM